MRAMILEPADRVASVNRPRLDFTAWWRAFDAELMARGLPPSLGGTARDWWVAGCFTPTEAADRIVAHNGAPVPALQGALAGFDMTAIDLGVLIGRDPTTISRWMTGKAIVPRWLWLLLDAWAQHPALLYEARAQYLAKGEPS
ncbi:hypothetical protein UFOVP469_30 [uncultured Caudovirales phage]|uniref:Uncharacterized protein n=1 Tax=uncultured Caudovirales phage TaxID=2100421 RepID=A0A6J5MLJ7_9CAUD|nr:hypothetical protein UFOVP469_30 [uncultured Caudovirales phage]CAB4189541.1 hypothetical protein UFOVP1200_3 [uncultured Caudovirales phage]